MRKSKGLDVPPLACRFPDSQMVEVMNFADKHSIKSLAEAVRRLVKLGLEQTSPQREGETK